MTDDLQDPRAVLLDAALPNVAFDGWSEATFREAVAATDISMDSARALFPRGAVDLALYFHTSGDAAMVDAIAAADMSDLRFRDKVALAVRMRLEAIEDKEAVRRAATLFALPHHAGDSAKALWGTADAIWSALGDTSDDLNWYTKRATLSGVYASTVLYWLGDDSLDHADTWAFLDRRIDEVMQIEKAKAQINKLPGVKSSISVLNQFVSRMRQSGSAARDDMPGYTSQPAGGQ